MKNEIPKIGVALSGASGRAITHIGVLEVLKENQIPIDYLTACSSGTLIAASHACGTMEKLKEEWLRLDKKFLLSHFDIDRSGKGLFSIDKFSEWFRKYTLGKNLEDVKPSLGFVCADIITSEPILLRLGDLGRAVKASCAIPGLIEPVEWGNRLLVDGGLFSIVPTVQARFMGADIVIGIDIASTRYMFTKKYLRMRKGYNLLRKSLPVRIYLAFHDWIDQLFTKSIDFIYYHQSDILEESEISQPGALEILGKALDISVVQSDQKHERIEECDYLITPNVKHLGKANFEKAAEMLREGRRAAGAAVPEIKKLIRDFEWRQTQSAGKKT